MTNVSIPITDHDTGSPIICTQYYKVKYRLTGVSGWTELLPNPFNSPIVLNGLADNAYYDYSIQRVCCNGSVSDAATGQFLTTP